MIVIEGETLKGLWDPYEYTTDERNGSLERDKISFHANFQ